MALSENRVPPSPNNGELCSHIFPVETHILNMKFPSQNLQQTPGTMRLCVGSSSGKSCNSTCRSKQALLPNKKKGCLYNIIILYNPILRYMWVVPKSWGYPNSWMVYNAKCESE